MGPDDPNEDWMPLADAARLMRRNPRILRRWADRGMLTKIITDRRGRDTRHTKLRYAKQWLLDHLPDDGDDD